MVRIYLIGAGVIARHHADAALHLGEPVELHVFDPSAEAIAAFTARAPGAIIHGDLESMLSGEPRSDDIVVVATPPRSHAALAIRAFQSGRHVLSEKPLGMSAEEALEMFAAARAVGKHLGDCSMRFLGYEAEEAIRKALAEDELGELYHVTCRHRVQRGRSGIEYQPEARWFLDRSRSGGGVLMDWSVYDLATLFDLLQPVRVEIRDAWTAKPETSADPTDVVFDVETHVGAAMRLTLAGGHTVALSYERASCTHGTPGMLLELEGLRGAATWQWLPYLDNSTSVTLRRDAGGAEAAEGFPIDGTPNWHHRPLVYFHRSLRGGKGPQISDERALFNFAVIQGIYAVATDGKPVTISLGERAQVTAAA